MRSDKHAPGRRGVPRVMPLALLLAGLAAAGGCGEDEPTATKPEPRLEPWNVVEVLETAYKERDIAAYSRLLADDFQFRFDPATRTSPEFPDLPEFWTRLQDSTGTGHLFASDKISNVRIGLTFAPDVADTRVGHERWRKIEVTDTFLSVDKEPEDGGEITTLLVDGDLQAFYLRQGHTETDTLPDSKSAREWFLVEWRDLGQHRASTVADPRAPHPTAVRSTRWGVIKAMFR